MDTGKKGTFGQGLQKLVTNLLPYRSSSNIIDDVTLHNPKYHEFYKAGTRRHDVLTNQSVVSPRSDLSLIPDGTFQADKAYNQLMYATLDADKGARIRDYRQMAAFAEVGNALDEICDEFLNEDDNGNIIKLMFRDVAGPEYSEIELKQINDEFARFINIYDLREKAWEYIRYLLTDGEVYFENIIHDKHVDEGIVGALSIPSHIIDPVYDNYQNKSVRAFLLKKLKHHKQSEHPTNRVAGKQDDDTVPLDRNQVTYINSGTWNEDRTFRVPFIENARRAYRQLTMIEDSIIIYRLARAPEKLVFNVDVGQMSTPKAEEYLRRLMNNYWSKKTFNLDENKRVNTFNPQSILDSYWFPRREGSNGTSVETLPGGANLGELQDLVYFVKKLYIALKVPTNRADLESTVNDEANTLREELKFANFVVRLQQQVARGFKETFIAHLKLRGMWRPFKLRENSFDIVFTEPRNYSELRKQQILDLKLNNFNAITSNESISKGYAQKHYLGWSDEQIKANRAFLRKDAALQHEISMIQEGGENWQAGPVADDGGMGGVPQGGDTPPEFGSTAGLGDEPEPPDTGDVPVDAAPADAAPAPEPEG